MNYKNCPHCDQLLPETCFCPDKSRKDGRRGYCKACENDRRAAWRARTGRTTNPRIVPKMCNDQ
jgi:hypothetical protein